MFGYAHAWAEASFLLFAIAVRCYAMIFYWET
jgi:hypothetical protein